MIRLIRYEFIKQFCKRSILALFVVFGLANLFKIYGEYQSYSYLTDGNGERSISRGRAARFITFMLAAPPHYPRLCLPGNVLFGWLQPTGRRTARWKNTAGNTSGIWNGWTGCFPPNR